MEVVRRTVWVEPDRFAGLPGLSVRSERHRAWAVGAWMSFEPASPFALLGAIPTYLNKDELPAYLEARWWALIVTAAGASRRRPPLPPELKPLRP